MRAYKLLGSILQYSLLAWLALALLALFAPTPGVQAQSPPDPPTGLFTSVVLQTEIRLHWTGSAGATRHEVHLTNEATGVNVLSDWIIATTPGQYSYVSLTPNTEYRLRVRALNDNGASSEAFILRTTLPAVPEPSYSAVTTNSFTLEWPAVSGATGYEYQRTFPTTGPVRAVNANTTSVSFSNLTHATAYGYAVRSIAGTDQSAFSLSAITYTNPRPPSNPRATCLAGTIVHLTWDASPPPPGLSPPLIQYELKVDNYAWEARNASRKRVINQLSVNTNYTFQIRAIIENPIGEDRTSSPISLPVTTAAAQVEPPTDLQTSEITNNSVKLTWTASATSSVSYEVSSDGSTWIDSGTDLEHVFSGLSPETNYQFRARAKSGASTSCPNAAPAVTTAPAPPASPTGLTTSGNTQTAITLSWTKSTGATAYKVQVDNGAVQTLGDVATHTFTGLSANTQYTLKVIASNNGGDSAAATVNASTLPNAPAAPTGLTTSGITQTAVTLSWTKSAGATAYKVQVDNGAVQTLGDVATHTFTGLSANTQYALKVIASNSGGDSAAATVNASTLPNAPASPTSLTTGTITQTSIVLNWTKSAGATGYKVQVDSGAVQTLGDVATYTFTGLTANTSYVLKVIAFNSGGDSSATAGSASTLPNAPTAPTGLTTSGITQTAITLSWTKSTGATSYEVNGGALSGWTDVGDVATYQFTGLTADSPYTLQVRAKNDGGDSAAASSSASTLPNAPAAPTGLATSGITQTAITLTWTKSTGATGYDVNGGALSGWTDVGDVATYSFTGLNANTSYTLQVRAKNTGGESTAASVSATTQATTPATLAAPTSLQTSGITQTAITLTWTKSAGATSYEMNGGALSGWTDAGDVSTYTFSGLSANTSYTLQVRAKNSGANSAAVSVNANTLPNAPAAPTGLTTSGITQTAITLSWTKSAGATAYKIQVDSGTMVTLGDVATHTFTGLSANTQYTLKVIASNNGGDSAAASSSASTLPNAPAAPTGLQTSGITQTAITLSWTKSTGATAYKVQVDSGTVTTLGDVATYTFTGLTANTQYTLKVIASNSGGDSAAATVNASTSNTQQLGTLSPPTGLTATGILRDSITLGWTKSTGATAYKVRKNGDSAWTTLGDVDSYVFTGLSTNTSYTLEVKASNSDGDTAAASISATTLTRLPTSLATPTNVRAEDITTTSITLNWTKVNGATGYSVRGYASGSPAYIEIGNVASHVFSGLTPATTYSLEVFARNPLTNSQPVLVRATTLATIAPGKPWGFQRTGRTMTSYSVRWNGSTGATAFKVQVDNGAVTTLPANARRHTFTGLTAGTSYTFKLVGNNNVGDSEVATLTDSTLSTTPAPAAPTGLSTSGITQTAITLSWTKSSGATAYKVQVDSGAVATLGDVATHTFTGLTANTQYTLKVIASNSGGDSAAASTSASTLAALPNAPAAPTGLSTSGITQTAITLSWTKSSGATAYKVQVDSGAVATLGDVATHTFTGLSAGTTYTLKVIASNSGGDSAAASTSASTLPNAPAAPTGLATSGITQTSITLTWTKSAGATSYKVRAGTTGAFTLLGDVATYTFTSLTANTAYTLQVVASNSGGDSSSAQTSANTNNVPPPPAPSAPTGLATSGITQSSITLTWSKSAGATGYKVQADSGTVTTLGDVSTYTFSSLSAGTSYTLKVIATNAGGDSAAATVSASTLPAAPTGLATSGITQAAITLSWTKSTGATAYKVQVDSGTVATLGDVATHTFTGLSAGTSYTLKVIASNSGGDSAAASISTGTLPNAPSAPTGLSTSGITQTAITLNWTKSAGATGYKVQVDSGAVTTLGDVATYTFSSLSAGTSYTLKVIATNAGGDSAAATVSASTLPAVPTGLATSGITQTGITLTWTKSAGATGYDVKLSTANSWTTLGDVATYTFGSLSANTQYTLQVRAKNSAGATVAASASARTLATQPAALASPTSVTTSGITQTGITLNWSKSSGATSYEVNGGTLNGWSDFGDVSSYTFSNLSADTQYTVSVRAKNQLRVSAGVSVTARTLPNAPDPPARVEAEDSQQQNSVDVDWPASARASSYEIRGSESSDQPGSQAVPVRSLGDWMDVGNVNSYVITGLKPGMDYTFEVRAKNAGGVSEPVSVSYSIVPADTDDQTPSSDFPSISNRDSTRLGGDTGISDRDSAPSSSDTSRSGAILESRPIATPTLSGPAFNCTEAQKARISISDQPIGLNLQCVGPEGIGNADLIKRGGVFGIDVWGWVRGYPEFCFLQSGDLAFLDAAYTPRRLMHINAYSRAGMTCAQIDRAGTLVLLPSDTTLLPTAEPTAASASMTLGDCSATTLDFLNLRASPGGAILRVLPAYVTLDVYKRQGAWIQVEYYGQRGWISAEYTNQLGDCG